MAEMSPKRQPSGAQEMDLEVTWSRFMSTALYLRQMGSVALRPSNTLRTCSSCERGMRLKIGGGCAPSRAGRAPRTIVTPSAAQACSSVN